MNEQEERLDEALRKLQDLHLCIRDWQDRSEVTDAEMGLYLRLILKVMRLDNPASARVSVEDR
jgi:hypothetical protein